MDFNWTKVKATREGLPGGLTSTGYRIEYEVPFVALPSTAAKFEWVEVRNPANGRTIRARVLDTGPWNTEDHAYVYNGKRPQAETGIDMHGRKTNGAGIDLGERVWNALFMTDNADVEWRFL